MATNEKWFRDKTTDDIRKVVNIYCHLERLGPTYETDGQGKVYIHFSLNLSAAFSFPDNDPFTDADVKKYLSPWAWAWSEISVLGIDKSNKTVLIDADAYDLIIEPTVNVPKMGTALTDVQRGILKGSPNLEAFRANPALPHDPKVMNETKKDWKAILGHVSTFPAPLSQAYDTKLSVFFRIKSKFVEDKNLKEIVAAPAFNGDPFGNSVPQLPPAGTPWDVTDPTKPLHQVTNNPGDKYYSWEYDAKVVPINVSSNHCAVDPVVDTAGSFISLSKLWVIKDTAPSETTGEDWTVYLEQKLADAFDMPRRLLDQLELNVNNKREQGTYLWDIDQGFHQAFVASLRDLANYGLQKPPEGKSLAEVLIGAYPGAREVLDLLSAGERRRYATVTLWEERLQAYWPTIEPGARFPTWGALTTLDSVTDYARGLEHVYSLLSADDTLVRFFIAEWQQELEVTVFWIEHKDRIEKTIKDSLIRKRMALGNVGAGWRLVLRRLNEKEELKLRAGEALADYFNERFKKVRSGEYGQYYPPISLSTPNLSAALASFASQFVELMVLPVNPTADEPGNTREELVIQVDKLQGQTAIADETDFLRRIAGMGVLLRKHGTTTWNCLSMAKLALANEETGLGGVSVPLRLGYRNGLRQSYLSYRNHPMAAESPAARFSQNHEMTGKGDDSNLLSYLNPYGNQTGLKLPSLVYGDDYDAAVFVIGNAGALPPELAGKSSTGKVLPWKFKLPDNGTSFYTQRIPFRRGVSAGSVRLEPFDPKLKRQPNEAMGRLNVPPIPDNVHPLTRSLFRRVIGQEHKQKEDTIVLLVPGKTAEDKSTWVSGRSKFSFGVRPPSVRLDVWDHWVSRDPSKRQQRINVWRWFHELADIPEGGNKAAKPDITIDDPAVDGIRFTFTQTYPVQGTPKSFVCPISHTTDCDDGLKCVQSAPIEVNIEAINETSKIPSACASQINIGIERGDVWKVEIAPSLSEPSRFVSNLGTSPLAQVLYLEVADLLNDDPSQVIQKAKFLNDALRLDFVKVNLEEGQENDKKNGEWLEVRLKPEDTSPQLKTFRDRIHRVEIMLQRWRWDGRPVSHFSPNGQNASVHYGFPVSAIGANETLDSKHDGTLFASRESSDHLSVPAHVDFAALEQNDRPTYQAELSALPGSLYFRAAVRAFNRYEGLLLISDSLDSRKAEKDAAEQWQRKVIPCRWSKSVPRPLVKLLVPLTQALPAEVVSPDIKVLEAGAESDDATPASPKPINTGYLAVLDESWYSDTLGGVGEVFDWDIARVALPNVPDETRLELSRDPLLDMAEDPLAGRAVKVSPAIGAIGYTHDSGTLAPLFTHASFVIPPPEIEGVDDLSWYFMKLRFRRRLTNVKRTQDENPGELISDWTDPVWAQLIAASNVVRVEGGDGFEKVSRIVLRASVKGFSLVSEKSLITLKPTEAKRDGKARFGLWVLFTYRVLDALGRRDQESFIKISRHEELASVIPDLPAEAVVRLVEVQFHKDRKTTLGNQNDLFDALFPESVSAKSDIEIVRIVSVSPPIEFVA